jgi:hypothetical protein
VLGGVALCIQGLWLDRNTCQLVVALRLPSGAQLEDFKSLAHRKFLVRTALQQGGGMPPSCNTHSEHDSFQQPYFATNTRSIADACSSPIAGRPVSTLPGSTWESQAEKPCR